MMKAMHQKLRHLATCQQAIDDGTRLYHDGSIRVSTVARGGGIAFALVAGKVPGAAKLISHYFERDDNFLKIDSLREAIEIRDEILTQRVQQRTHRALHSQIEREVKKKNRTKSVRMLPEDPKPSNPPPRTSTVVLL